MIFLSNVAKFYGGKPLLEGVSISIHRGDRIGLVGPNGAGKSTLLGMMEGVVTPDEGEVSVEKRIRMGVLHQELVEGHDGPILEEIMNISDELRDIRKNLTLTEQKMARLSENSPDLESLVQQHGDLQHEFERYDGYTLEARALKVLQGLGFRPGDEHRLWSEFSGGWRMRVAIAKILLSEPDALLLDEPTNHLDLESLLWVEEYLSGFKGALLLVSHDRAFLNRLVKRIIEVDRGKASTFTGNYDDYERTKGMQEEVLLAAYKNQQEKIKRVKKFIDQNRVKARTASRVQSRLKMLEKMDRVEAPRQSRTIKFTFPQPPASGRRVLEIRDLVKRFDGNVVYDGLDLNVERQDRIGLVGPNGAGKSTLLKIMAGVLTHEDGDVKYGHNVYTGYFAQHQSETLNTDRSVLEEASSVSPGLPEQEVRNLLAAFLFSGDDVQKKVKVLSGGEKSRLALVKILLAPPNFLLMDEPTNHLDIPSCEILEQGLKRYSGTLVMITHDRRLMNEVCTAILEIRDGAAEQYLGNYVDYEYKKSLMEKEQEIGPVEPPVPAPRSTAPVISGESRKERKRREAQNRIALFKRQAPIKAEIERIEKRMQTTESRLQEIETQMAKPSNYENKDRIVPLLQECSSLSQEMKDLEVKWEEMHTKLEEMEGSSQSA